MGRAILFPVYQDTIYNSSPQPDTGIPTVVTPQETIRPVIRDSLTNQNIQIISNKPRILVNSAAKPEEAKESTVVVHKKTIEEWNSSGNFLLDNGLKGIVDGIHSRAETPHLSGTLKPDKVDPVQRNQMTYDWLLGIFLFLVILFVWIRTFYSKFFGALGNALISYHLSLKLFEEKNVLLQRVSIVLDFIYVIVFSVFLFEFIEYSGLSGESMKGFNLFLLLLNIVMLYVVFRTIILRMTGGLFMARSLFSEYIHNTLVINKGLGIALFPVVIMAQYLPYKLIPVILILGFVLVSVAFVLKSLRSYQIIIRRDVLLFYLILYLCTLEILPLLLGYKFVKSLIQSN